MVRLLPSEADTSAVDDASPRVIGLDGDDADSLLSALSSGTARNVLSELHDDPDTPSALANRVDTSLQNVQYHLSNLEDAGLVAVVDTVYSEKGREMKVYAPADRPLVMVAGGDTDVGELRSALTRLLGGVALLGVLSALVQAWLRGLPFGAMSATTGGGAGNADGARVAAEATAATAAATGGGLPPGLVFFLGGLAVLLVAFAAWYARQ